MKNKKNISIDIKSLFILSFVFILFTVIGTLSHEYGHITIAKILGYETKLHYGSMECYPKGYLEDSDVKALDSLTKKYTQTEFDSWPENVKEKSKELSEILHQKYWNIITKNSIFITIGGPLQTILTGTIGLLILIIRKKSIQYNGLKLLDWTAVFLSLFWLREVFNLITSIGGEIISPKGRWFGGDEFYISQYLNIWSGTISIILGIIGFVISVFVVFKIIPDKIRLTFILSGFIGGILGFIMWMFIIGPKLLP